MVCWIKPLGCDHHAVVSLFGGGVLVFVAECTIKLNQCYFGYFGEGRCYGEGGAIRGGGACGRELLCLHAYRGVALSTWEGSHIR